MASTPSNVEAGQALTNQCGPGAVVMVRAPHGTWSRGGSTISWGWTRSPHLGPSSGFGRFRPRYRRESARDGAPPGARRTRDVMDEEHREETLLTPGEVAARFRVDPKTVTRWANAGKLTAVRTLGGHRRFRRSEVDDLLVANGMGQRPARD